LRSAALDEWIGATAFVKAEHRQTVGAFKYRGATNAVQSLSEHDARAVWRPIRRAITPPRCALAASTRGIPAFVVMPENTSHVKRAAVERYGGPDHMVRPDPRRAPSGPRTGARRDGCGRDSSLRRRAVIAGAGTAALELLEKSTHST
jgi:threonine dehydratase